MINILTTRPVSKLLIPSCESGEIQFSCKEFNLEKFRLLDLNIFEPTVNYEEVIQILKHKFQKPEKDS